MDTNSLLPLGGEGAEPEFVDPSLFAEWQGEGGRESERERARERASVCMCIFQQISQHPGYLSSVCVCISDQYLSDE